MTLVFMNPPVCDRCGVDGRKSLTGWWFRPTIPEYPRALCVVCVAIVAADYGDHGDEHVDSLTDSAELHRRGIEHQCRSCRICISAGAPLRPDVRWRLPAGA